MGKICESRANRFPRDQPLHSECIWNQYSLADVLAFKCPICQKQYGRTWLNDVVQRPQVPAVGRKGLAHVGKKFALEHAVAVLHCFTMFYIWYCTYSKCFVQQSTQRISKKVDHVDQSMINPVQAKKMNHMLFFLTVGSTIFTPVTFMSSATCQRLEGKHLCRQNVKTRWFHQFQTGFVQSEWTRRHGHTKLPPRCMAWTSRALTGFQRSHFYLRNMVILTFGRFGFYPSVVFFCSCSRSGGKCRGSFGLEFRYGVLIYFMLAISFVVFVYQRFNQSTKRTKRERYLPCCGCCNI